MRRCPGCTFQICQPCFDKRLAAGKSLAHGNFRTPSIAPIPVVRRRLFTGAGGAQPPAQAVKEEEKKDSAQEVTPPKTDSRKRDRKAKKKAPVVEFSSEDEDDFDADRDSPTTTTKRQKTAEGFHSPGSKMTAKSLARAARQTASEQPATRADPPSSPSTGIDISASIGRPLSEHSGGDLFQQFGIEAKYDQHPLARHNPIMSNRAVASPPSLRWDAKPRKSQEEIERAIQTKTREKMGAQQGVRGEAGGEAEAARVSIHAEGATGEDILTHLGKQEPTEPKQSGTTIREFIETEARNLQQGVRLHRDQQESLVSALKEVGRNFGMLVYSALPEGFKPYATPGLDLQVDKLHAVQKQELEKLVREEAMRKLKALEAEASLYASSSPGRQAKSAPAAKTGSPPPLPPVGFFRVSQPQPESHSSVGGMPSSSSSIAGARPSSH